MPSEPPDSPRVTDDLSVEVKLRAAFELSPTILAITTAGEGRFLDVNEAFTRLHGYTRDEVIGRTISELDLWIDPQQRRDALAAISVGSPVRNIEARLRTKDGGERVCVLNADIVTINGRACILTALMDITERIALEAENRARREEAEALAESLRRANRAKDEFLAMLGHELRNPLGTITNAMALLEKTVHAESERQVIAVVSRQTGHLARLVDDLLDMARLTSGQIRLQLRPVDLHAVAARGLEALAHSGRSAEHRMALEGTVAYTVADPARLEQIVGNLLDNALKYTPAGGRIVVCTTTAGDEAILTVTDTGKGIAPDLLPRVFDLFVQAPQALDRPRGGLGLGLAVVKRLVELHGGSVSADSPGAQAGSAFTVRLKASAPPAATDAAVAQSDAPSRRQRRVLVVEDNADARDMLRTLLELSGHVVETADDGPSGLATLRSFRPDVALIDVGLPGLDGYTLARTARADGDTGGIRLVALTGYGQDEDRARALAAGFDRHVTKPIDPVALEAIIDTL